MKRAIYKEFYNINMTVSISYGEYVICNWWYQWYFIVNFNMILYCKYKMKPILAFKNNACELKMGLDNIIIVINMVDGGSIW